MNISVISIIYAILMQPIQILFEIIYGIGYKITEDYALSIIILSIAVNFLVLPLYKKADAMQEEERDIEAKLANGVAHIKKTFKGDERMMMLQTYYRQNSYKPTYVLKSASSLLLQIPFFIVAYKFLSGFELLQGVSFGLISDLSKPDGLLKIAGLSINILPIVMTLINIISSAIYSKDYPIKTKLQLYITALFFLVFLYKSPSGLVFYWTLNNCFSLVKTIVFKTKDQKKTTAIIFSLSGIVLFVIGAINFSSIAEDMFVFCSLWLGIILQFPLMLFLLRRKQNNNSQAKQNEHIVNNKKLYICGCAFMTILTGVVIPSNVIAASPEEFVSSIYYQHPFWYIASALSLAIGTFMIWLQIFYTFSNERVRNRFEKAITVLCPCSLVSYMGFSKYLGLISPNLSYGNILNYTAFQSIINALLVAVVAVSILLIMKKFNRQIISLLLVSILAFSGLSVYNMSIINKAVQEIDDSNFKNNTLEISLSKNSKNVVVIMLDRAMGIYVPYMFNEREELKRQFSGFTYYSNVISYGRSTIYGSPSLFGGYEYTPTEINTRSSESLLEKHNEALKIMPVLFSENGFNSTVCNPTFANYKAKPDTSIYDDYKDINTYCTESLFLNEDSERECIESNRRKFFIHSLMLSFPIVFQNLFYDSGLYYEQLGTQNQLSCHTSIGIDKMFENNFSILQGLPAVTSINNNSNGNFFMMSNDTTHEATLLQEPEYLPFEKVDNIRYDKENEGRYAYNGVTLNFSSITSYATYQVNMASMIQLGKWFDYLKEQGVYDNTRIIIVSDHGYALNMGGLCKELIMDNENLKYAFGDATSYYPLLMVKDFYSKEFSVSDEFMTNADVPTIAFDGLIENPINPFTNKAINSNEKFAHNQYVIASMELEAGKHADKTTFVPAEWYTVHDSIWDKNNWEKVATDKILTNEDVVE